MFTIKIHHVEGTTVYQATTVETITREDGDALKEHVEKCNALSASIATPGISHEVTDHADMKAVVICDFKTSYLYPGDRCYITNDQGQTVHSLIYKLNEKGPKSEFTKLLDKIAIDGGCIVSSSDCSEIEISDARCRDDFYVDNLGFGYVRRAPEWLQKHSRFARGAADNNCEAKSEIVDISVNLT